MEISASPAALVRNLESPELPFWTNDGRLESTTDWIKEGYLHSCLRSGTLKKRFYRLSTTELLCFKVVTIQNEDSKTPIRRAGIGLKLCLPFFNPHEKKLPLGFKLLGSCEKMFYAETPEDLDHWVSCLSLTSLLLNLESDFKLLEEIGCGNFSQVFLAQKTSSPDQLYAVKRIRRPDSDLKNGYERIAREIQTCRRLAHPNIVKLHYVYCSLNSIDLVMDYLPGGSLDDWLFTKGALSLGDLRRLTKVMIDVCQYLHDNGVTHRDIKPENVLLTSANDFQLTDFGLAAACTSGLTDPYGSPGFAAPELVLGKEYDQKVDIFSCGITIVTAALGSNPVNGRRVKELAQQGGSIPDVISGNIEWNVFGLVSAMLELDPAKRPSARELSHRDVSGNSTPKGAYPKFSQDLMNRLKKTNRPSVVYTKKGTLGDDWNASTSTSP